MQYRRNVALFLLAGAIALPAQAQEARKTRAAANAPEAPDAATGTEAVVPDSGIAPAPPTADNNAPDDNADLEKKAEEDFFAAETAARQPSEAANAALAMIDAALKKVDDSIARGGNGWQFQLGERIVIVVTDPLAERMRIISPIAAAEQLTPGLVERLMQANYDSALDARYAIAQNLLWGVYNHELTSLNEKEFLSGLLQVVNIANNFGTSFSSGEMVFGGGDSQAIINNQLEELIREREKASKI
jgi:hypothetical protein